ncbi:MAG: DNA polymerase III subunit gamma/tau [Clostridia bacterium]|nr:DNA polymerase III subunit gamma/tau [Clostridia bacterium]
MESRTLYRAFRPSVFGDVSGQDHVTQVLRRQIETGQPAHAYLFCGSRGTGKTTTARILANAVNCLHPVDGSPCGECEVCRMFAGEQFVDVVEIDAASNSGVENIRDIREKAALLPIQGRYKVYIIDEAHMLSAGAFNALLKTLEEPPAHTIFILATTELRKIPKTIQSRCQHFDFRRITPSDIVSRLRYVAGEIGVRAEDEALALLAAQAEGALRDALSLLEQCSAGRTELTAADVLRILGLSDARQLSELGESILAGDAARAVAAQEAILAGGTAPGQVLQDLTVYLSDRLAQTAGDGGSTEIPLRALDVLIESHNALRYSPVPQAVLLAAVVRAANTATDVDLGNLEARLQRLEAQMERLQTSGRRQSAAPEAPAAPQAAAAPPPASADPAQGSRSAPAAKAPSPATAAAPSVEPENALPRFRKAVTERNAAAGPAAAAVAGIERRGGAIVLHADSADEALVRFLVSDAEQPAVLEALSEVYGSPVSQVRAEFEQIDDEESAEQVMSALNSAFRERVTVKND